uniref:RNA-dependent RNA polymerase n=1 Tax=Drake virus TaxID=2707211 RepID=A0A6H0DKC4_9VIRU|nr:MAG: RNA-dependent RNA polymerase [Drake virus]
MKPCASSLRLEESMTSMVMNQTHVGCLVTKVVLGRNSQPFQREVERLLHNNGPEWLSSRMKAIWTAANHLRNGKPEMARSVYQDAGIAYHKGDMTPKGPFRPVVRSYRDAMRPSVIRRYAAVLRFYTTLVLPRLSRKQSEKAYEAITSKPTADAKVLKQLENYAFEWGVRYADAFYDYIERLAYTPTNPACLAPNTYRYSRVKLNRSDRSTPLRSLAMSLLTEGFIPEGLEHTDPFPLLRRGARKDGPMGRIGVIQEQGAKARVVAMPSARLQYAFHGLHEVLASMSHTSPTSVMHDQQKAIYSLCQHMEEGKQAFSTDLSSATDRFPRSISLALLRGLGLDTYARALEVVSSGDWESPWGLISYGTGQPMGLYSSFPLFHMSNQMVADYARRLVSFSGSGPLDEFSNLSTHYVLGDDIIFSDHRVERQYRSIMESLGVPISEQKSFQGDLVEFAGFVVTRSKGGKPFAFQPYKPPAGKRVTNPINFLAALGAKAKVINQMWDKRVNLFSRTWSDRTPGLVPWVTKEEEPLISSWDSAALDNEFNLLSSKYPLPRPDLDPHIRYSDGLIRSSGSDPGFTIKGLARDKSRDLPQHFLETNRERLGQQPKHPRRVATPFHSDPLIKRELQKEKEEIAAPQVSSQIKSENIPVKEEQSQKGRHREEVSAVRWYFQNEASLIEQEQKERSAHIRSLIESWSVPTAEVESPQSSSFELE